MTQSAERHIALSLSRVEDCNQCLNMVGEVGCTAVNIIVANTIWLSITHVFKTTNQTVRVQTRTIKELNGRTT